MVAEAGAIVGQAEVDELELYRASAFVPGLRAARNLVLLFAVHWISSSLGLVLGRPSVHAHDIPFLLAPPGILLLALLLLRRRWVRRNAEAQGLGRTQFRVDVQGIELHSSTRQHALRFDDGLAQLKTPLGIWLYAKGRRPLFVPRTAFDEAALRRLTPLLAERLPLRRDRFRWLEIGCLTLVVIVLLLTAWHYFVTVPGLEEFRREQEVKARRGRRP
jgi:hypothetical protein